VIGASDTRSFCRWLIQQIKDQVHPTYEYWGQSDPTREVNRKVSKEEMVVRVSRIYSGKVKIKKCPKAHSLKRPADSVSPGTCFRLFFALFAVLRHLTLLVVGCLQECERQFWCPAPLREGEQHRRKLRSDKYQPPQLGCWSFMSPTHWWRPTRIPTLRSVVTPGRARMLVVSVF
jgi:hypothetical protein